MPEVAVIGGGIAGLTFAASLDPARWHATVYEQRPESATVGTALGMWRGAMKVMDALGLGDVVRNRAMPVPGGFIRDGSGRPLAAMSAGDLVMVTRADLLGLLAGAVPESVTRVSGRVESPLALSADVVVGADGVHSVTRRVVWGDKTRAIPTDVLAVRGMLPGPPGDTTGEYWGDGDLFGISPSAGDGRYWYASFRSDLGPHDVDVATALDVARDRFAGHAPAIRAVLDQATPATSLAQRIWVAPPMLRYTVGSTALIGDAAHAMTPNLGRGACESIVDAHLLATQLNTRDTVKDAFATYEGRRVAPTQALRFASSGVMRLALLRQGRGQRDAVIGFLGSLSRRTPG